jgi:hypothetical protein
MELFNVVQFFEDGSYEYVRKNVTANEAVSATQHYTTSIGAQLGTTVRVIITDMMDCIAFEWEKGKIIFPTQQTMDEVMDKVEKN